MFTANVLTTVAAAAMNTYAAYIYYIRADWIVNNMTRYGVPHSWLPLLAVLKAAGALGLLVGIGVHLIGSTAAIGLMAYFVGALVTLVRARCWSHIPAPVLFLLPITASLALLLAAS